MNATQQHLLDTYRAAQRAEAAPPAPGARASQRGEAVPPAPGARAAREPQQRHPFRTPAPAPSPSGAPTPTPTPSLADRLTARLRRAARAAAAPLLHREPDDAGAHGGTSARFGS
ncbi:hypothetical protein [Streptomyces tubercidicus]|uniref:hypothetical protein n=1 Tax=Streptomyces tubercidicus TaxID=47759 RepID=UPI003464FD8B